MFSVTALSVLHVMCILCLHLLVDGQVNVPPCTQLGSKRVGEYCFNFNPSQVTWYQAKSTCEVNGTMTLAYVSSRQQIIEIVLEFAKVYPNRVQGSVYTSGDRTNGAGDILPAGMSHARQITNIVWIGASDEKKEGEFIWVASNEKATELEKLWFNGGPNGSDDCVGLYSQHYINNRPCNSKFPYLCIENTCPYDLKVRENQNTSLLLSWMPGFNGGLPQTFTILCQNLRPNRYSWSYNLTVPRVTQTSSLAVYYFVNNLPTKTPYLIYIEASINNGKIKCTRLTLTTQTTGPPECPVNITILEIAQDHVSLSWEPGEEDKLHRTYNILAHNTSVFKNISLDGVSVGRVYTNNYTIVMYTVGNLSELTQYTFSVDVENNFEKKECKDNFIQVTTTSGLQKHSFPAWLIFLLIFIPLVLATGITGFFVYKRKANRAKALQINTFPASFKKSDNESIYHTVEEAAVAMTRASDDGHRYDLTIDEPDLEVFKSNLLKRESIAPLPPPRSSEKNKLGTICSDVSQYDVCGAHDIDHPYMKIDNSTSQDIASFKGKDNSIIENKFIVRSVNKGDNNSLHTSFGNQNKSTESAGINSFSKTFIEFKNNTNENSSPLSAQNKHQYSSNDREFKTEEVKSVKTLKATDEYTRLSHCEDSSQELDSKTVENLNKTMKEKMSQPSDKKLDGTQNKNSNSLNRDLADTEAYQGCYSSPLIRNDEHFYAPLSCVDSRIILMLKDQDHNAYDEQREEHKNDVMDKQKVACDFKKEIDEIDKSRIPNVELTVQAYNADNSMSIPPMLSNFVIEKGFAMRDDDSNEIKDVAVLKCSTNGLAGDIISSNSTKVEENEYITPLDSETYPMMLNRDEIGTETKNINTENWYPKFEGAQCEDGIQIKQGCENKEEYLTWDGVDVSCADDVPNNYIPIFASSGRQVVLDENSKKAEPAENQCVDNFKVAHSEIQEDVLVYWTPDGTNKRTFDVPNQISPDEYSAPNDYLKNY